MNLIVLGGITIAIGIIGAVVVILALRTILGVLGWIDRADSKRRNRR